MMNFNVKYHFSHALMHWLREEGALGEELERASIIVACKKKSLFFSFYIFLRTQCLSCVLFIQSHTSGCAHTLLIPSPVNTSQSGPSQFTHSQVRIMPLRMEEVWHWQTFFQLTALLRQLDYSLFTQTLLAPFLPHCRQTCLSLCSSSLPSCLFPSKVSADSFVPNSGLIICEAACMSGKPRKKVMLLGGLLFFFKSVLSWAHKAAWTPPAISLLISTHARPVLSWFLFLSVRICVKTHTHTNSWNTQYFLPPYICVFLYHSTQMFLVTAVHVQHKYEHIHTEQHGRPAQPCFLPFSQGWPRWFQALFSIIRPLHSTEMDIFSPSSCPTWLDQVGGSSVVQVWLLLSPGPSLLLLKDHSHRTPGLNKTFTMLE